MMGQSGTISGTLPVTGEEVDGVTLDREYDLLRKEVMQVMHSHNLTAGQAQYLLRLCTQAIDIATSQSTDY